jgi:DNA processing protein
VRFRSDRGHLVAEDLDRRVVRRGGAEYPLLLEQLPDPPASLWVAGRWPVTPAQCVAVVGTRTPTSYGREIAYALASELARAGVCVVSGMARGVDASAHEGALEHGSTIAVLAGGVDVCYPSSNRRLYERIVERGAVVAEQPPGTPTYKGRFTHRNRIIAALSLATVVVQAGERSGALSTARHALDIGRDVLAVPGDIRVDMSAGSNGLLRDGAHPCTCAADVLGQIGLGVGGAGRRALQPVPGTLSAEQIAILELIGGETLVADDVGSLSGLRGLALATSLSALELAGWIEAGPGGTVRRIR